MTGAVLLDTDRELLLHLLRTPTVGPLETIDGEPPAELSLALRDYATAAAGIGLCPVHNGCASVADATRDDVPLAVRRSATAGFLEAQPSLVLRLGPELPSERTVMFNVHLDTVSGLAPVGFAGCPWA